MPQCREPQPRSLRHHWDGVSALKTSAAPQRSIKTKQLVLPVAITESFREEVILEPILKMSKPGLGIGGQLSP